MMRIVFTISILLAAAAVLYVLDARPPPLSDHHVASMVSNSRVARTTSHASKTTVPASNPTAAFAPTMRQSMARAQQGDSDAMRQVADTLRRCAEVPRLSDEALTERLIDINLKDESTLRDSGITVDPAAQAVRVQNEIDEQKDARNACAFVAPAQSSTWIAWLQRAADAGNRDAEREYVDIAYAEFRDGVPADRLEDAAQRRDTVRRYAEDLVLSGDCSALASLQWSVNQPVEAYRYRVAYAELTRRQALAHGADPASLSSLDDFLSDAGSNLSDADRTVAETGANALLRDVCQQ